MPRRWSPRAKRCSAGSAAPPPRARRAPLSTAIEVLGQAAHPFAVGAADEGAVQRREEPLDSRRLQPGELEGDPGATTAQLLETKRATGPAPAVGADAFLDDLRRRLGLDHLDLHPLVRARRADPDLRLRSHAPGRPGEAPV